MTTIANSAGVFARLGYNFDDPNETIQVFSDETKAQLNAVPALLDSWAGKDLATSNVSAYYKNPVATDVQTISNSANSIVSLVTAANGLQGLTGTITTLFANIAITNLATVCQSYKLHTDRLSGVRNFDDDVGANTSAIYTSPYKDPAIGYGKSAMYIVNQTDGIVNTAPILGSFTSLFVGPQINANSSIISTYYNIINNSITITQDTSGAYSNTVHTSNLSLSVVTTIDSQLANTTIFLANRENHDKNYYANLKTVSEDYQELRKLQNLGQSESTLIEDFIGTDKLLSRLNA
jgi:hypothetical protein